MEPSSHPSSALCTRRPTTRRVINIVNGNNVDAGPLRSHAAAASQALHSEVLIFGASRCLEPPGVWNRPVKTRSETCNRVLPGDRLGFDSLQGKCDLEGEDAPQWM